MSQNSLTLPTTGTVSGLQMTQYTNNAIDTLNTLSSGASAPSSAQAGQLWHDTANNIIKLRSGDNTAWISLLSVNQSAYIATPYAANQVANTASNLVANMASLQNSMTGGFVNVLRNPSHNVNQRGLGLTSISAGTTSYTSDGWIVGCAGASISWSVGGGAGYSSSALNITGNTSCSSVYIKQRIESSISYRLTNQQCTLQFYFLQNTGATITPALTVRYANAVDNWSSSTVISTVNLQSVASGSWTLLSYCFPAGNNAGNGLEITIDLGAALNSTSKVAAFTSWDLRATPGVATGLNSNPPVPELRPVSIETVYCQRYYQVIANSNNEIVMWGQASAASQIVGTTISYNTTMRASPSTVISNGWAVTNCSQPLINSAGPHSLSMYVSSSAAGGVVNACSATTYITLSAEL